MILYIDTSDVENMTVALGDKGKVVAKRDLKAKYRQAEKLLSVIDSLLKKTYNRSKHSSRSAKDEMKVQKTLDNHEYFNSIKAIAVVKGPGPFTALRIGVATANALGYAIKVPVIGIKQLGSLEINIKEIEKEIIKNKHSNQSARSAKQAIIEPEYGGEPNITKSSKF